MKIKGKRVLKNGAVAGYVWKDRKWKWRIIKGPSKKRGGGKKTCRKLRQRKQNGQSLSSIEQLYLNSCGENNIPDLERLNNSLGLSKGNGFQNNNGKRAYKVTTNIFGKTTTWKNLKNPKKPSLSVRNNLNIKAKQKAENDKKKAEDKAIRDYNMLHNMLHNMFNSYIDRLISSLQNNSVKNPGFILATTFKESFNNQIKKIDELKKSTYLNDNQKQDLDKLKEKYKSLKRMFKFVNNNNQNKNNVTISFTKNNMGNHNKFISKLKNMKFN